MQRGLFIGLCLAVFVLGTTPGHLSQILGGTPEQVSAVRADEIGTKVQIIGRLGKPMGTMVTIRGTWQRRVGGAKPAIGLEFRVTDVDDRQLPQSVVFLSELVVIRGKRNVAPEEGSTWELRAFETGQFRNIEARNWKEFYNVPVSPPDWGQHSVFVSELTGIIKSVSRSGERAEREDSEKQHRHIAEQQGWLDSYLKGQEILRDVCSAKPDARAKIDIAAYRESEVAFFGGPAPPGATNDLVTDKGFYLRIVTRKGVDLRPRSAASFVGLVHGKVLQVLPENKLIVIEVPKVTKDWVILETF